MICTPNDILFGQIKSRMRCIGHMECRGGAGNVYTKIWWEELMEQDYLEDLGIDETII